MLKFYERYLWVPCASSAFSLSQFFLFSESCPKAKPYNCCSPIPSSIRKSTSLSQKMMMQRISTSWSDRARASGEGEYWRVGLTVDLQCRISFRGGLSYHTPNKRHMLFLWLLLIQATKHIFDHSIHVTGLGCRIMLFLWSLLIQATKNSSNTAPMSLVSVVW